MHQSLFHPSILSLFSSFSTPSALYHVLEYCPNGTLAQILHASHNATLCEPELRGVAKGIIDGLVYLRKELVIHRDIKPSNILLNQHWRIVSLLKRICVYSATSQIDTESIRLWAGSAAALSYRYGHDILRLAELHISVSKSAGAIIRSSYLTLYLVKLWQGNRIVFRPIYGLWARSW